MNVQCRIHKGSSTNIALSQIKSIPRIDTISSKSILILSSHLCQDIPRRLLPAGLSVIILKALLHYSTLSTCPAHIYLLDLITLTTLSEQIQTLKSLIVKSYTLPILTPFGFQVLASGSCFQTLLASAPPIM